MSEISVMMAAAVVALGGGVVAGTLPATNSACLRALTGANAAEYAHSQSVALDRATGPCTRSERRRTGSRRWGEWTMLPAAEQDGIAAAAAKAAVHA